VALLLKSKLWLAYATLVLLNTVDAALTALLVVYHGPDVEANPVVRYWIHQHGIFGIYLIKALILGIAWLVIKRVRESHSGTRAHKGLLLGLWAINILLTYVIYESIILVYHYTL
jgi:hypothetical protein